KAEGSYGHVTYKGFKVEGSEDIRVVQVHQPGVKSNGACVPGYDQAFNVQTYREDSEQGRHDSFVKQGSGLHVDCKTPPGRHLAVTLRYTPRTVGVQAATVTLYHDGNENGYTSF